jgi:hypothetical protein
VLVLTSSVSMKMEKVVLASSPLLLYQTQIHVLIRGLPGVVQGAKVC